VHFYNSYRFFSIKINDLIKYPKNRFGVTYLLHYLSGIKSEIMKQANYYGAYLGSPMHNVPGVPDGKRMWMVYYRVGNYMYDRLFADCPYSVKRQIVTKGGLKK
jgi:hypothetical protein